MYRDPATFEALIDRITEATIAYLLAPGRGRGRGGEALRLLGGRAAGAALRALLRRAGAAHRRGDAGGSSRGAGDRVSARRGGRLSRLREEAGVQAVALDTGSIRPGRRGAAAAGSACRATSTRCCWSSAARRSSTRPADRRGLRRRAAHLQPRPRHHAGRRSGACRGDAAGDPRLRAQPSVAREPEKRFRTMTPARISAMPSSVGWSSRCPKAIQPTATIITIPMPDQMA